MDSIELFQTGLSDHEYPSHYHETFCITLIESGTFCENELLAPTGTILISHPFEVHQNKNFQDNFYSHTTFYVSPDIFRFIGQKEHSFFNGKVIYDDVLFSVFRKLSGQILNFSNKRYSPDFFEKPFLNGIYHLIEKHSTDQPPGSSKKESLIDDAKRYILRNLETKISLDELAGKFGMNRFKFIRRFKRSVGLTPFDYIILNRIERGKKLIEQGKPLAQTAIDTGFYDQSHFSNYFKRFVGITPKIYQKGCNIFQEN